MMMILHVDLCAAGNAEEFANRTLTHQFALQIPCLRSHSNYPMLLDSFLKIAIL